MNKRKNLFHKILSLVSGLTLVFNSILPAATIPLLFAQPVHADEATQSAQPEVSPTDTTEPNGATGATGEILDGVATESAEIAPPAETATPATTPPENMPTSTVSPTASETGPPAATSTPTATPNPTSTPEPEHGELSATIIRNSEIPSLNLDIGNTPTSATLATDKADYAPSETVIITGNKFTANRTYTLEIYSTYEQAPIDFQTNITADTNGSFLYSFPLNNVYRPNYTISVKDGSTTVATTTFTDTATKPNAPNMQSPVVSSTTSISLRWKDKSDDEDDFHLFRKLSGNPDSTYTEIATVSTTDKEGQNDILSYTDTGLSCYTHYVYKVQAHRHNDNVYSNGDTTSPTTLYISTTNVTDLTPDSVLPGSDDVAIMSFTLASCRSDAKIKAIKIQYTGTDKSDLASIKIYAGSTLLGTDTSGTGTGEYSINIAPDFPIGNSTAEFTIAADIKTTATVGNRIDTRILQGKIDISDNPDHAGGNPGENNWPLGTELAQWDPDGFATIVASLDTTPPETTIDSGPSGIVDTSAANFNFSADEPSTFTCALDGESFTDCTSPTSYSGLSEGTHTFQVEATDSVGNSDSSPAFASWTVDTIAPTITGTILPASPNAAGWYTTLPVVTYTCSEDVTCPTPFTFGEGTGLSHAETVTDAAGHSATTSISDINVDTQAPAAPTLTSPTNNAFVKGATLTNLWSVASGATKYIYESYYNETATSVRWTQEVLAPSHSKTATHVADTVFWWRVKSVDAAGNQSSWSDLWKVTVDNTAPNITIAPYTTAWTNHDITVTATTNEGTLNTNTHIFSTNGSFDFIATDAAGNTSTVTVTISTIDKTLPDAPTIIAPTAEQKFKTSPILNKWSAVSDTSGIHEYKVEYVYDDGHTFSGGPYRSAGTATQRNHSPASTEQGGVTLHVQAIDNAGNESAWSNPVHYMYDATAPILTSKTTFSGWYNTSQVSTFAYSDALTAIVSGTPVTCTISTPGANQTCSVTPNVCDAAGNCNTATVTSNPANIDPTKPSSSVASPAYVNEGFIPVSFTANDEDSGIASTALWYRVNTGDGFGLWTDSGLTSTETSGTFNFDPEGVNGTYEFYSRTTDNTENVEDAPETADSSTIFDTVEPSSVITVPANTNSGSTVYTNNWTGSVEGNATDGLSGVSHVYLSIQRASDGYYWKGDAWQESSDNNMVVATGTTNWSYVLSHPTDDTYTIQSHAEDAAGNLENTYQLTVVLDRINPTATLTIDPTTGDASNGWYKTDPTMTLSGADAILLDHVEYQFDSQLGTWTSYGGPFKTPGEGGHMLYFRAWDKAGNVSTTGEQAINYDKTNPDIAPQNLSVSPNPSNGAGIVVKWDPAHDNVGVDHYRVSWVKSGSSETGNDVGLTNQYTIPDTLTEESWTIRVTAYDAAGNSAENSAGETVDLTGPAAPVLSITSTGVGTVSLSWTAVSDAVDYSVWYGVAPGTYLYAAHVGNGTTYTISGLGTGTYYVSVAPYDSVGNRGSFSNEVNTGATAITGSPEATTGPAEGFSPANEVFGASTPSASLSATPEAGQILGETQTPSLWTKLIIVCIGLLLLVAVVIRKRTSS